MTMILLALLLALFLSLPPVQMALVHLLAEAEVLG